MIFKILENTIELWMTKYIIGETFRAPAGQLCIRTPLIKLWGPRIHCTIYQNSVVIPRNIAIKFLGEIKLCSFNPGCKIKNIENIGK